MDFTSNKWFLSADSLVLAQYLYSMNLCIYFIVNKEEVNYLWEIYTKEITRYIKMSLCK